VKKFVLITVAVLILSVATAANDNQAMQTDPALNTATAAGITPSATTAFQDMCGSAVTTTPNTQPDDFDWQHQLSPTDLNSRWHYRLAYKNNLNNIRDVTGILNYKTVIDGKDYYYYFVPQENKGNLVRFAADGAYMRKLNFPVFGIIFLDVELNPEIQYMKFPVKVNDEWYQDSTGTVTVFGFIKIKQPTTAHFKVQSEFDAMLNGKKIHGYKIANDIDRKDGKIFHEEDWYAIGPGLIYSNTEEYILELKDFEGLGN
jgi:hypothetical protein